MKKRVLSILLAMSVSVAAFTGCGSDVPADVVVDPGVTSSTEDLVEIGSMEKFEESSEASTEASVETSSEASTEASVAADVATGEWANAYEDYFNQHQLMRDNSQLAATITKEGVTMDIITAVSGENFYMSFNFGAASVDMYAVDNVLYSKVVAEGQEAWTYAPIQAEEDTEMITDVNSSAYENENIVSWKYLEEVTEEGVVYDALEVEVQDDEGETDTIVCYVNRDTQEVDKYVVEQDGESVTFVLTDIEGIELPAEAANATESTPDDIAMGLFGVIMMVAMSSVAAEQ